MQFRLHEKRFYKKNADLVEEINGKQKSWKAGHYDFMTEYTIGDVIRMCGGKKSRYE